MPNHSTTCHNTIRLGLAAVALLGITSALADYQLRRVTINNGGQSAEQAQMTSGRFAVQASAGQTDASADMHSNQFQLQGGFWHQNTDLIFKNSLD